MSTALARPSRPDARRLYLELRALWKDSPLRYVQQRFGAEPTWQQAQILEAILPYGAKVSVRSGHGIGKAQPKGLVLDTPAGRKCFGDLQLGDSVFGQDGLPTTIVAIHEQGEQLCYRVAFDDDTSTVTCGSHLWAVRGRQQRRLRQPGWLLMSTTDIARAGVPRKNGLSQARQWEIPSILPVVYREQSLPLDAYTLGVWLGNGTCHSNIITINSNDDEEVYEYIGRAGYELRPRQTTTSGATMRAIEGLQPLLRDVGLWDCTVTSKYVPLLYKENTPWIRAEILRGLLDTDGYCTPNGIIQFSSASSQLAQDVAWLVRSLGGKAHVAPPQSAGYRNTNGILIPCHDAHILTLTMPDSFKSFYVKRKAHRVRLTTQPRYLAHWITAIEPIGYDDCRCITVNNTDGLYLANDFLVTHNSSSAAWIISWFVETHDFAKVPCTAPTARQLRDILWGELSKWRRKADEQSVLCRLPERFWLSRLFRLINDSLVDPSAKEWGAFARTAKKENPEALQGFHADNLMFCIDEASGVVEEVFEAAEGALSTPGARVLMLGNPTRNSGTFAASHKHNRGDFTALHFRSQDSPLVDPGYRERLVRKWGEGSNVVRVRADGEFPKQEDDVLISLELTEPCTQREPRPGEGVRKLGVDVARLGSDRTALVLRQGSVVDHIKVYAKQDTMQTVGCIVNVLAAWKVDEIAVDVIGLGAGVYDRLAELKRQGTITPPVVAVNVAQKASPVRHPADAKPRLLRDSLWLTMAQWLREDSPVFCAEDRGAGEDLAGELASVGYGLDSQGQLVVEDKDHMRKRLGQSPDLADALACTFAPAPVRVQTLGVRF